MRRVRVAEQMDDPALPRQEHQKALDGLVRLNSLTGVGSRIWTEIKSFLKPNTTAPTTILEIASGAGDLVEACYQYGSKAKTPVHWTVSDYNPRTVQLLSTRFAQRNMNIAAIELDALKSPSFGQFDLVLCNLFLHHFDPPEVIEILRSMKNAAKRGIVICDLNRGWFDWILVWIGCHGLSRSSVVHHDGPASVRAAYIPAEIRDMAEQAGLHGATVKSCFPCRWTLRWERPPS